LNAALRVEAVPQLAKTSGEYAAHRLGGGFRPLIQHVGPTAAAPPGLQQAALDQPCQSGAHRHPSRTQRRREVAFDGQPCARQVFADRDRGDQTVGDLVDA
jgi:hypothetical protein